MEIFRNRINIYSNFIKENKVSDIVYYTKMIYENIKIIKLLENNLMTPELFSKFNNNYKWDISKYLINVIWCCDNCLYKFSSERPSRTWGVENCPNCDKALSYRTGGGQNDPFNYTFIFK